LIYTGSDDGKINVTQDGGNSWNLISENLPQNLWVSRILASAHKKQRVYATLNGYRNDDFAAYVYASDDFGTTWKNIANNLPKSAVNVIIEDPKNENILYVGTDNGLFISLNNGDNWQDFSNEMPNVAVHDLVIQKTAKEIIVGTHGRSIYKASIAEIQELNKVIFEKSIHIFEPKPITKSNNWGKNWNSWRKPFEPTVSVWFYSSAENKIAISIENNEKAIVNSQNINAAKGLNKIEIPLIFQPELGEKWNASHKNDKIEKAQNGQYYLPIGNYAVKIKNNNIETVSKFEIVVAKKQESK